MWSLCDLLCFRVHVLLDTLQEAKCHSLWSSWTIERDTILHVSFGDLKLGNRQGDGIKGGIFYVKAKSGGCKSSTWPDFTTRITWPLVFGHYAVDFRWIYWVCTRARLSVWCSFFFPHSKSLIGINACMRMNLKTRLLMWMKLKFLVNFRQLKIHVRKSY